MPTPSPPIIATDFSSRGPSINGGSKPDVTAVGTDVYMAAELWIPPANCTAPMATRRRGHQFCDPAGQRRSGAGEASDPNFTPAELKSAVVNTGAQTVVEDNGSTASVLSAGGGLLNVGAAIASTVAVAPAMFPSAIWT